MGSSGDHEGTVKEFRGDQEGEAMEAEAVANQLESLRITTHERAKIVAIEDNDLEEADEDLVEAILCKILTLKTISPEVFKTLMPRIWGLEGKMKAKTMGKTSTSLTLNTKRTKKELLEEAHGISIML